MKKRGKLNKERTIFIIGIILIIASIIITIPAYVRESRCEKIDLEGELNTPFYIFLCPKETDPPGDINVDGCVDSKDLALLTEFWLTGCDGTPPCGSNDCACILSDVSDDGCVNADDYAILAAHWGECESRGS